jgi:muramoyltetrapeptide carboxypeptidase
MPDYALLRPRAVRPGDRVAILAPASPFPRDEFLAGVEEVRRLGLEPVFDLSVFDRSRYTAGGPASRAQAFVAAWQDPAVAALLTARGGYGSVELLPYLSIDMLRRTPKLLVGFSDVTALLGFLTTRCRVTALHGPTVAGGLGAGPARYDRDSFVSALMGVEPVGTLAAPGLDVILPGEAAGELHGGNLTQLAASMGTPYAFDPPGGSVLFLEDVNERPYRIDRLLTQLKYAGVLTRAAAIVFGQMAGCDEPDGSITAREVAADVLRGFGGPVLWGLPAGHTEGPVLTIPLGVRVRVVSRPSPAVDILESAVVDDTEGAGPARGGLTSP